MAVVTPVESGGSMAGKSGAPSARNLLKSLGLHLLALLLLLLIPASAMRSEAKAKELQVVFHRTRPKIEVPARPAPPPAAPKVAIAVGPRREGGKPAPSVVPDLRPSVTETPGPPELAPGPAPVAEVTPKEKVGNVGILAFRDKIASVSRDRVVPRLGADARYS